MCKILWYFILYETQFIPYTFISFISKEDEIHSVSTEQDR